LHILIFERKHVSHGGDRAKTFFSGTFFLMTFSFWKRWIK